MKALIVDDNEINAMLAAEVLDSCGLASQTAESGAEAIELVRKGSFCFVLMDYVMEEMDGLEATRRVREFSDVPIYAMSGDMDENLRKRFIDAGAQGMVAKPFKIEEIRALVKEYLGTDTNPGKEEDAAEKKEENEPVKLKEALSKIEGLDYESGLTNALGSEKGYHKLLSAAVRNLATYATTLKNIIETKNGKYEGEYESLKLVTHSLAGVYANIGIDSLRATSKKLERKIDEIVANGSGEINEEELKEYSELIDKSVKDLSSALESYDQKIRAAVRMTYYASPEVPLSEEDYAQVMDYTAQALEKCEIDYLLEGLDHLKKASAGDERRKIENAIEAASEFDYETVKSILFENET